MKYCVKNKVEMTQWEIHKLFFLGGFGHAVTTFQSATNPSFLCNKIHGWSSNIRILDQPHL